MLSAHAIVDLHDQLTRAWHLESDDTPPPAAENRSGEPHSTPHSENDWLDLVARQHRANFDLWHIEDEARTPGVSDAELAGVKRRIDSTNQLRNDLAEYLDRALLDWLAPQALPNPQAPLHSESPGLMIDRCPSWLSRSSTPAKKQTAPARPPATTTAISTGSPFLRNSAPTSPTASMSCGGKRLPASAASSFTAS